MSGGQLVEQPHQEIGEQDHLGRLGRIIEIDPPMALGILEQPDRAGEKSMIATASPASSSRRTTGRARRQRSSENETPAASVQCQPDWPATTPWSAPELQLLHRHEGRRLEIIAEELRPGLSLELGHQLDIQTLHSAKPWQAAQVPHGLVG
jgi:hypothetical protein